MDTRFAVPRDDHVGRGCTPAMWFVWFYRQLGRVIRELLDRRRSCAEVSLREQIRVDVVVADRAVFVGSRDTVDSERSLCTVVVAEREPESGCFYEELKALMSREGVVARCVFVARDGVRDVCGEMESGRSRR